MCVRAAMSAVQAIASIGSTVARTAIDAKQQNEQSKEYEYRSQIALSNYKTAQNNAKEQIQLGIDKSREQKIEGLKKASVLLAKNASSGFDALSDTNYQNYSDVTTESYDDAQKIMDSYNLSADSYFQKANSYLNDYNNQYYSYKKTLKKNALNSLGNYTKVALSWFK